MKLEELARLAGVSKATANIILSGKADRYNISDATRSRVMALVDKYHYMPDTRSPAIRSGQLALIIPSLLHREYALLTCELERLGRNLGYQWQLHCSQGDPEIEKSILRNLSGDGIVGIATISSLQDSSLYQKIASRGVRVIALQHKMAGEQFSGVVVNDQSGTYELTRLLLDKQQLPGAVVYFGGNQTLASSEQRLRGFQQAMSEAGYTESDSVVFHKEDSSTAGYSLLDEYYQSCGQLPKNLLTASFSLMQGALKYLQEYPERQPELLNWASFEDADALDLLPLSIHSSGLQYTEVARNFYDLLGNGGQGEILVKRTLIDRTR